MTSTGNKKKYEDYIYKQEMKLRVNKREADENKIVNRTFGVNRNKLLYEIYKEEQGKWLRAGITKNSQKSDIYNYYANNYSKYVSSKDPICIMRYRSGFYILQSLS